MTSAVRTAASASIGFAMLVVAAPARPRYSIVDIGVQLGDFSSFARDINDRRQVVGAVDRDFSPYPFMWEDGVVSELPPLAGESSGTARAINNRGQIVGDIALNHAVLWEGGTITELVTSVEVGASCSANAINDRGQIAGACDGSPFLWEDGSLTWLPTLPGGDFTVASGINQAGTIVGSSATGDRALHAVFWRKGELFELAPVPGSTFGMAIAINDRGQIVGMARDAAGVFQAVLWQQGEVVVLETLPGVSLSRASAINNRGQIAGMAGAQPVLWEHGSLIRLVVLREGDNGGAQGINNRGDIVGFSGSADTSDGAVLWTHPRPR